jgi:hypothetical protein
MAPGSYLILSHLASDGTQAPVIETITGAYRGSSAPVTFRSAAQIECFFDGLHLVGLAAVSSWRARQGKTGKEPPALNVLGGVGRVRQDKSGQLAGQPEIRRPG